MTIDWASQKLRVGIVGLGWTGWTHLKAYQELPNVEVIALAGYEADRLAQYGREFNVPNLYREYQDLLARDDLDVVSICTPNQLHKPIAIAALEGGRHVVCEKPLARSTEEALAMVEAARKADRVLHTVFNHRERGDVAALKRYIDEGGLGRIYHAKASWMRRNGIPTLGSWFTNKELAGGGPLIDLGVHMLDLALYLSGEPQIATVSAATYAELGPRGRGNRTETFAAKHGLNSAYEVEDLATGFLRATDGTTIALDTSWAVYGSAYDDFGVTLFGTEGGAEIRVLNYSWEDTLRIFIDVADRPSEVRPQVTRGAGHLGVISQFLAIIRSGEWEGHHGEQGMRRAQIIEACYASAQAGREVVLNGER